MRGTIIVDIFCCYECIGHDEGDIGLVWFGFYSLVLFRFVRFFFWNFMYVMKTWYDVVLYIVCVDRISKLVQPLLWCQGSSFFEVCPSTVWKL